MLYLGRKLGEVFYIGKEYKITLKLINNEVSIFSVSRGVEYKFPYALLYLRKNYSHMLTSRIKLKIIQIWKKSVSIGIEAPKDIGIVREELLIGNNLFESGEIENERRHG